jgi:hypothetical protein
MSQNVGATPLLVACGSGGMLLVTRFNDDEFSRLPFMKSAARAILK